MSKIILTTGLFAGSKIAAAVTISVFALIATSQVGPANAHEAKRMWHPIPTGHSAIILAQSSQGERATEPADNSTDRTTDEDTETSGSDYSEIEDAREMCVVGVASDDVLNMRSGAGSRYRIVGEIPPNACGVQVSRSDCYGRWCRASYDGVVGWISTRYVSASGGSGRDVVEHCVVGVESWDTLNMRTGPSSRNRIVGEINYDACEVMVNLDRCRGRWCYATHYGVGGWIHTRYVRRR